MKQNPAHAAPSASARIADFITRHRAAGPIPDAHVEQTARALIDTVACALAGRNEPAARIALEYARTRQSPQSADAWGTGASLSVEDAALYNGVAGHVLDFDDVTSPLRGHPSIALLPALVALAQAHDLPGRDLAAAYVAGFEVMVKLARAMVGDHYAKGWHSTSSIGILGATAACASLLRLTREQTIDALGIAVAQASGSRVNFGTMSKSFQAGHCGVSAIRAAMLARSGFTGAPDAIDGENGYMALYANGESLAEQLDTLGTAPLEIEAASIEVKKYPLCYATHRTLDGILDLRAEHGLRLDQVERVEILCSYRALVPLIHPSPQTGLEAKFSMQYAVAAALHDGAIGLSSFEDAAVRRPAIQTFLAKVEAREDSGAPFPRWNEIRLHTRAGAVLEKRVTLLRGSAQSPLSRAELLAKARDCFAFGGIPEGADAFADAAFALDGMRVRELFAQLPQAREQTA
jgi:2-methylcitrate dehydratase PrpD